MKIEIWSDVLCPFCYIGKRNFETALEQFPDADKLEISWKSFQLDPTLPTEKTNESYQNYLIKRKGISAEQVKIMLDNVTTTAKQAGLEYHLDKSVIVNSLNAHKLLQFAKTKNLDSQLEERLFQAFFTEGKNIADIAVLTELGREIGLDEKELQTAFTDDNYAYMVSQDISEAQQLGVRGVPFFLLNSKYGISGAQPSAIFLENLEKSFTEWQKLHPKVALEVTEGQSCTSDGVCE